MYVLNIEDGDSAIIFKQDGSMDAYLHHDGADTDTVCESAVKVAAVMTLFGDTDKCISALQLVYNILNETVEKDRAGY
jgi:hypothetical protein